MAQDFVGSNNINLLVPSGQFGTRLAGGSDAASPRYIFTHLAPVSRYLFPEVDDALLSYRVDDGQSIEPEYFCPVIPLLLVNGSQGIGTGWSTNIPPHNPLDVADYILAKLDGSQVPRIKPFARGFDGSFLVDPEKGSYVSKGRATPVSKKSILIDELPLRCWTNAYKQRLLKMRDRGEISNFVENHTTSKVSFKVTLTASRLHRLEGGDLEKALRLVSTFSVNNMHAFDENMQITKYDSPESIADAFFPVRLRLYGERKRMLEADLAFRSAMAESKARFISLVKDGSIDLVSGATKQQLCDGLQALGFATAQELKTMRAMHMDEDDSSVDGDGEHSLESTSHYDYLLGMPLSSLTQEKVADLHQEAESRKSELADLRATTPEDLWREDLRKLKQHL